MHNKKHNDYIKRLVAVGKEPSDDQLTYFDNLDGPAAKHLLKVKAANPEGRQNDSPTFASITNFLMLNKSFRGIGYIVNPVRDDERITLEGVIAIKEPAADEIEAFVELFRLADEFDMSPNYRAWFD